MKNNLGAILKTKGMTLVEVLISLVIVSFVFVYITNTTFGYIKRVKVLEEQDKMLNLASEAVELLQNEKAISWSALMSKFPSLNSQALVTYDTDVSGNLSVTGKIQAYGSGCIKPNVAIDERLFTPSSTNCSELRLTSSGQNQFARVITLIDPNVPVGSRSYAQFQVTIACAQDTCDPTLYNPIVLTTYVYKTANN